MIPTLLLVGLVLGGVLHRRPAAAAVAVAVVALAWAIGLTIGDDLSLGGALGAFALALINTAVGAAVAVGVAHVIRTRSQSGSST
jgi:hypothetical protein